MITRLVCRRGSSRLSMVVAGRLETLLDVHTAANRRLHAARQLCLSPPNFDVSRTSDDRPLTLAVPLTTELRQPYL